MGHKGPVRPVAAGACWRRRRRGQSECGDGEVFTPPTYAFRNVGEQNVTSNVCTQNLSCTNECLTTEIRKTLPALKKWLQPSMGAKENLSIEANLPFEQIGQ